MNSGFRLLGLLGFLLAAPANPTGAATVTVSNLSPITIADSTSPPTKANPYPSSVSVSAPAGQVVAKVTVQIHGYSHGFPDDVLLVLAGPQGRSAVVFAYVGDRYDVTNVNLTLDSDAANSLPLTGQIVSGTFKPTQRRAIDFTLPPPAPPAAGPASFEVFNNIDPNGTWSLFAIDEAAVDSGVISGGWTLNVTLGSPERPPLSIARAQNQVVLSWPSSAVGFHLQTALDPNSTTWTNAAPAPVEANGKFVVTNTASSLTRYYRLKR